MTDNKSALRDISDTSLRGCQDVSTAREALTASHNASGALGSPCETQSFPALGGRQQQLPNINFTPFPKQPDAANRILILDRPDKNCPMAGRGLEMECGAGTTKLTLSSRCAT